MKRLNKRIFGIVIGAILLIVAIVAMVYFRDSASYQSNFKDRNKWLTMVGSKPTEWQEVEGGVQVSSGVGNKFISKKQDVEDFTSSVTVTTTSETKKFSNLNDAGLIFRANGIEEGADYFNGYYFGIDLKEQQVFLKKGDVNLSVWTEIATKHVAIEQETDYRLTVQVAGNHIIGYINQEEDSYPVIDVVDEEFTSGEIGLLVNQLDVTFADFSVDNFEALAVEGETYLNAILPEAADPDVLYWNGTYYLYPTTPATNIGGIKVYTSTDLVNWTDKGMAMTAGEDNWGESGFWAPDLIERDGKFYMYYTANERLCVSVSDSPLGPFKQINYGPMHEDIPEIDAHAFRDEDGQYYFYFVRFNHGNLIYGAKLNDDMITIDEDSIVEVLVPSQPWEKDMANINEGPFMLTHDGKYYLTYSGSHFESPMYGAGYAVSDSPLGPFEKYAQNPIMQSNELAHGTGHHAVTESPDGTELFMVYHRHQTLWNTDPREFAIDRMRFTENAKGETILEVYGPTVTPQPIPSGAVDTDNFIAFDSTELAELAKGVSSVSELPTMIAVHTSKSEVDAPIQAAIEWSTDIQSEEATKSYVIGTVQLPEDVTNTGELSLEVKAYITNK